MTPTCQYEPVTFGDYDHPAPEPVVCGAPAKLKLRVTYYKSRYDKMPHGSVAEAVEWSDKNRETAEIDHTAEVFSCLDCFSEALQYSGHPDDFDPEFNDPDEFDSNDFNPDFGPRYEILEEL